jgi:glycerol-3-phosphate dehydrogenase
MLRDEMLDRVRAGDRWDVVIVGGGATGLGTALDAALRGYRTLLLEGHDFAKGTSSRSTKLIHGGVRYLANGQVRLVREALHERSVLLRNAPHLVHPLSFVIPAYRFGSTAYYGLGLRVYDWLAGRQSLGRSRILSSSETIEQIPTVHPIGLRGGVLYHDAQFDDARLAIALLRSFLDAGGTALNYAPCISLRKDLGSIRGLRARDKETGEELPIDARVIVNATGVFADGIRRLDDPAATPIIRPSQGIHLVLSRDFLPGDSALLVPRTDDGRVMFAIPWCGQVLLGTTDTPVSSVEYEPRPREDEIAFLLAHAGRYLSRAPERADVLSTFAGLRPLVGSNGARETKTLSREHALFVSSSGLVTIVGGKWTTYRRMAADTVDRAAMVGGLPGKPCLTEGHRLHGAIASPVPGHLAAYGSEADSIRALELRAPRLAEPIVAGLPYTYAEVVWAARNEMARSVEDVLARRTRLLFLNAQAAAQAAPRVAEVLGKELSRGLAWQDEQIAAFRKLAITYSIT